MKFLALAAFSSLVGLANGQACAITDQTSDGNWETGAIWDRGLEPRTGDEVTIDSQTITVTSATAVAAKVTVSGTGKLVVSGTGKLTVATNPCQAWPTSAPTPGTAAPTRNPTRAPTNNPTSAPTFAPTLAPTDPAGTCYIPSFGPGVIGTVDSTTTTPCSIGDATAQTNGLAPGGGSCTVQCDYANNYAIVDTAATYTFTCNGGVLDTPTLACENSCSNLGTSFFRTAVPGSGPMSQAGFLFECRDGAGSVNSGVASDNGSLGSGVVTIVLLNSDGEEIPVNELPPGDSINFVIPFEDGKTRQELVKSDDDCVKKEIQCEWWDVSKDEWSAEGCRVVEADVTTADGSGVQCECGHLTDFALVVREEKITDGKCAEAASADVAKIALFSIVLVLASVQAFRGGFNKPGGSCSPNCPAGIKDLLVRQHLGLALVGVLRMVAEATKSDVGVSLMMGVIATYIIWLVFLSLITKWTEIAVYSMSQQKNPMRMPFIVSSVAMGLVSVGVALGVVATDGDTRIDLAVFGGYAVAAVALVCGIVVSVVGFQLALAVDGFAGGKTGTTGTAGTKGGTTTGGKTKGNGGSLARKLRTAAVLFSVGFVALAVLNTLVINAARAGEDISTLSWIATGLELVILFTFIFLFSAGVSKSATLCGSKGARDRTGTATGGTAGKKSVEMAEA